MSAAEPERPSAFAMLGVIHGDPTGEALLGDRLESLRPGVITLEFSPYGLEFRRSRGKALKERACEMVEEMKQEGLPVDEEALASLLSYIDLPQEYAVASDYCRRHGIPLFLIDVDRFSSRRLSRMGELLARENLVRLLAGPGYDGLLREKALARLYFEKGVRAFSYTDEMRSRDRHMSRRISALMQTHRPSLLAHVCGWQHLSDPFALYAGLSPGKVFIHEQARRI